MTSRFTEVVVDCHDPHRLAEFWCAVLGFTVIDEQADADERTLMVEIASWQPTAEAVVEAQMPPTLLFLRVPESKSVKNRLHLDVSPVDCSQADEVERLVALGATPTDVGQSVESSWTVMQDPEGNEFCVLRSLGPTS
jgi:Glyoxalase-like domain